MIESPPEIFPTAPKKIEEDDIWWRVSTLIKKVTIEEDDIWWRVSTLITIEEDNIWWRVSTLIKKVTIEEDNIWWRVSIQIKKVTIEEDDIWWRVHDLIMVSMMSFLTKKRHLMTSFQTNKTSGDEFSNQKNIQGRVDPLIVIIITYGDKFTN